MNEQHDHVYECGDGGNVGWVVGIPKPIASGWTTKDWAIRTAVRVGVDPLSQARPFSGAA
jgi:hypothetical protein